MKNRLFFITASFLLLFAVVGNAQIKIGNNPTTIGASSLLELESTTKGIVFPRLTGAQMIAIPSPVAGMQIYNTDSSCVCQYNGTAWRSLCGGNTGSPYLDWHVLGNSGTSATTNFIGTIDAVDFIARTTNTERMRIASGGKIGIAGVAVPTYDFSINGDAGRAIGMERSTLGVGNFMTVRSGSALSGGTDLNGGVLNLVSGIATGTGNSSIKFFTSAPAASSGTADNNLTQKMIVMGNGNVGIGSGNPLAQLSVIRSTAAVPATSGTSTTAIGRFEAQNNALDIGAFTAAPYGNWMQSTAASDLSINSPISLNPNGGYIGIGSIAPNSKLELLNDGVGGANDDIGIKSYGSGKTPKLFMQTAGGTFASPTNLSNGDDLGSLEFWGRTSATDKIINSITNKYVGSGTNDFSEIGVKTSGIEHFRMDSIGRAMLAINTTTYRPKTSFHMYGDGTGGFTLQGTTLQPVAASGPEIGFSRGGFTQGSRSGYSVY